MKRIFIILASLLPGLAEARMACDLAAAIKPDEPNYFNQSVAKVVFEAGDAPDVRLVLVKKDLSAVTMPIEEFRARKDKAEFDGNVYFNFQRTPLGTYNISYGDVDLKRPAGQERKPTAAAEGREAVNLMALDRGFWAICNQL